MKGAFVVNMYSICFDSWISVTISLTFQMEVGVGNGPQMRLKGFRNINKKTFGTVSINSTLKQSVLTAGLQGSKIIIFF